MMIEKIISGGQTGVDQGALAVAKALGLATGGWMPHGFLTEAGPNPALAAEYGLQEHSSRRYPARTQSNVLLADATLLFGNLSSPGTTLTRRYAESCAKPLFMVTWSQDRGPMLGPDFLQYPTQEFLQWLRKYDIRVLNVAGNRESQNPGIYYAVKFFLVVNLTEALKPRVKQEHKS